MQGQSPPPAWLFTCARVRQRRTRRCGQSSRSSRPDVLTDPPKSLTREAPPSPPPDTGAVPDRPLNPQHTCPLSRLCTHRERRCPSFQFNYKQKQTLLKDGVCVGSVAMEWGGLKGMDENHTHTHHILRTAWGAAGMLCLHPTDPPVFHMRGQNTCPSTGTCHLSHTLSSHCCSCSVAY